MAIFFSSPIGLGHVTRDLAIFRKILQLCNHANFEFVSGSLAYDFISHELNLLYGGRFAVSNLYSPPPFSIDKGELLHSFLWLIKYVLYYYNAKKLVKDFVSKDLPQQKIFDVIISDEDLASLSIAKDMCKKNIFITDILYTRFARSLLSKKIENFLNKSMHNLVESSDCVIIPDYGDSVDNYFYVGPIVREITFNREILRKKFSFKKKTILLTVGGTLSGYYLIKNTLESFHRLQHILDCDLVISLPPTLSLNGLSLKSCRNVGLVYNLHEYIFASDLVISLAGKSTIDECMVYGTPGIFIPIKNHFEQEERAKQFGYKYSDIHMLDSLIKEKLFLNHNNINKKHNDGALKAAHLIQKYLNN